jgi:exopolysaccharide biosynthesis polyprenyl glycosylphosphotransferase
MERTLLEQQPLHSWPALGLRLRFGERRSILFLGDVLSLLCAGLAALAAWAWLAPKEAGRPCNVAFGRTLLAGEVPWLLGLAGAWLLLWAANGGYDLRLAARASAVNRRLLVTALVFGVAYLALFFVLALPLYAPPFRLLGLGGLRPLRLLPTLFLASALVAELGWRNLYALVLTRDRFRRRVLVMGAGRSGQTIAQVLREHGDGTYEIVGFVDDDKEKEGQVVVPGGGQGRDMEAPGVSLRVLGDRRALQDLIATHDVSTVVLAITHEVDGELLPVLLDCLELGVEIVPMPVLYEELTGRVPVEHVGGNWYVAMPIRHPSTGGLYPIVRRGLDILLAGLGLVFLGLALPLIAVAIYLDSPGPVFYTQERVGKGGRIFRALKFRSMVPGAENGQAVWASENDCRVTRVGRILRRTHVDEFPQFLNIVKGEMSAVGPRPERPEFAEELAREIPFYRVRHAVRPGMAGWALVRQGYASSKDDALLRLQYDLYYIKHQSVWLDLTILFRTVVDTVTLRGR